MAANEKLDLLLEATAPQGSDGVSTVAGRGSAKLICTGLLAFASIFSASCGQSPGRVLGTFDIGGYELFLYCLGQGSPTLVLDAGAGGTIYSLHDLVADAAAMSRVCLWDRPGLGRSEAGPLPTSSSRIAEDLRAVLEKAQVRPPFLPVGHSFGGMNMRLFASRYRDEVAGLVLIDPSHPDQFDRFAAALPPRRPREPAELRSFRERDFGNPDVDLETSFEQVRSAGNLGDLPLWVVSRSDDPQHMMMPGLTEEVATALHEEWMAMQKDYLKHSSRGEQFVARQAGHCVHCTEPGLVVEAIRRALAMARSPEEPAR